MDNPTNSANTGFMASVLPSAVDCCDTDFCAAPITVSVPGPPGADGQDGAVGPPGSGIEGFFVVDTLPHARLIPKDSTNQIMFMMGSTTPDDEFGGVFKWNNTSIDADDYDAGGGTTINPAGNVGSGRWKRFI